MTESREFIITLYKQHYRKFYPTPLSSQYSCWGYYDGLSINPVVHDKNAALVPEATDSPVSVLWYGMEQATLDSNGLSGRQLIGVFRTKSQADELSAKYWSDNPAFPYTCLCIIKLDKTVNPLEFSEKLETEFAVTSGSDENIGGISFFTFENADLIFLTHSNSLKLLCSNIIKLKKMSEIRYMHSIHGVSEAYLSDCFTAGCILADWNNVNCHINENVYNVRLLMTSSGDSKVEKHLYYAMTAPSVFPHSNFSNAQFHPALNHSTVESELRVTDVQSIFSLLIPNGALTHQNGLYPLGLYNIETSFSMTPGYVPKAAPFTTHHPKESDGWCSAQIIKLCELSKTALSFKEESLYAYLAAITQTLNNLSQYENYELDNGIFFSIFPAFKMFAERFIEFIEKYLDDRYKYFDEIDVLKATTRRFIDTVNAILFHTVHTDQIFLTLPGNSGSAYSIPHKLQLMALYFINEISDLYNDNSSLHYQYLLAPIHEATPSTEEFILPDGKYDRLIRLRVSHRSLSFPKSLCVILAHEAAHYSGTSIRSRKLRKDCILEDIAGLLVRLCFAPLVGTLDDSYDCDYDSESENYQYQYQHDDCRHTFDLMHLTKIQDELHKMIQDKVIPRIISAVHKQLDKDYNVFFKSVLDSSVEDMHDSSVRLRTEDMHFATFVEDFLKQSCPEFLLDEIKNLFVPDNPARSELISFTTNDLEEMKHLIAKSDEYYAGMSFIKSYIEQIRINKNFLLKKGIVNNIIDTVISGYKEIFSDICSYEILDFNMEQYEEAGYISKGFEFDTLISGSAVDRIRHIIMDEVITGKSPEGNADAIIKYSLHDIADNCLAYTPVRKNLIEYASHCRRQLYYRINGSTGLKTKKKALRLFFQKFSNPDVYSTGDIYEYITGCIREYENSIQEIYDSIHELR